jgi:hypothetical protein
MIKGLKKQLETIRDNVRDTGALSDVDTAMLQSILAEMRPAGNDNTPLTDEQLAKLSIVEKTGTGSKYVH